ncbi:MAG: hypothetical protein IPP78_10230 [Holophagaceae bacterium]|nr:hypothetical protein [Holophagaceae bacterium]
MFLSTFAQDVGLRNGLAWSYGASNVPYGMPHIQARNLSHALDDTVHDQNRQFT